MVVFSIQESTTWKIVNSPPNNMDLNGPELVETDVIIADNFMGVEFHFEIKQERTRVHKIFSQNQVIIRLRHMSFIFDS